MTETAEKTKSTKLKPTVIGGGAFHNIKVIMNRELKSYFSAPIAYIFITLFALITSIKFMLLFFIQSEASMRNFFEWLPIMMLVFIPPVTMRLWAEERKHGTIEFLLTLPMKSWHIMMGKYFASLVFYIVSLLCSLPIPIMLASLGSPDWGQIITGYIGAFFLGGFYLALGIFISAFFLDQIIAYIVILSILAILSFAGWAFIPIILSGTLPGLGEFAQKFVGVTSHLESLNRGIIDIKDIIYFITYTGVFLFLNNFFIKGLKLSRKSFVKSFVLMVVILIGISFTVNLIFENNLNVGRFDLTQNKIFTVSKSTGKVFDKLKYPVTVSYYVTPSDKMPVQLKNLEREVRDKISELQKVSSGKLRFKVYYPDPNSATAEKLAKKGIQPQQVQTLASDAIALKLVYSTLVISYLNQKDETVKMFDLSVLGDLEYIIASKIYKMTYAIDDTDYNNDSLFTSNRARELIYPDLNPGQLKILYLVSDPLSLKGKLPDKFVGIESKVRAKLEELKEKSDGKIGLRIINGKDKDFMHYARILVGNGTFDANDMIKEKGKIEIGKKDAKKSALTGKTKKTDEIFISGIYMTYKDVEDDSISTVSLENVDNLIVDINKKISKIIKNKKPKVAIFAPRSKPTQQELMMAQIYRRPTPRGHDDFAKVKQVLSHGNYDVVRVDFTKNNPIPDDVKTIVILRPDKLNKRQVYEIDRLIHKGKNFIFAVESQQLDISQGGLGKLKVMSRKLDSGLDDLFSKFGVKPDSKIYLDDNKEILTVYTQEEVEVFGMKGYQRRPVPVENPAYAKVLTENMNKNLSFTNRVDAILYCGGSPLKIDEDLVKKNGLTLTKIFSGSDKGWSQDSKSGEVLNNKPSKFEKNVTLAVMLKGKFPSLYEGKEVPKWPKTPKSPNEPPQKDEGPVKNTIVGPGKDATVLMLGCAEMFNNNFISAPQHRRLLLNMVDSLTLDENLVNIRSKSYEPRKLRAVSAKQKVFWKFMVIGLFPFIFILIGIIVISKSHLRTLKKEKYVKGSEV